MYYCMANLIRRGTVLKVGFFYFLASMVQNLDGKIVRELLSLLALSQIKSNPLYWALTMGSQGRWTQFLTSASAPLTCSNL